MSKGTASKQSRGDDLPADVSGGAELKKGKQMAEPSLNLDELRELADLVIEHGFTDFEFENENIRVRLSKALTSPVVQTAPVTVMAPAAAAQDQPQAAAAEEDVDAGLHKIISPIVGTFYRSPGPDKDPYVSEGSRVSPETTVCIVEAMKLMNEIQAEVSGEVVKVYVENGQPVEYGQPLFGIKK
jgi:acetyl-CoA carboxylase biotin carboxyl carrier protein